MTTLLFILPWVASVCGAVMIGKALRLWEIQPGRSNEWARGAALVSFMVMFPLLGHAAQDLQQSVESGNAVIMYLSATLAAVGIISSGIAMMMGRHSIAKWAFAGAMVSGLAFAIVRTMWERFGLTAPDVGTF